MNSLAIVTSIVAFVSLLSATNRVAQAGPLHQVGGGQRAIDATPAPPRRKREIYPEVVDERPSSSSAEKVAEDVAQPVCVVGDLVYEPGERVPAEQPCLQCRCRPPDVHCETTRCAKQPGCRAIHKPNACCPEYQCECAHEGRAYANGERLDQQPGAECQVCYCRGGEVQCAEVSCYVRNDCVGRRVPGKCCPKYEHCPPKEPSNAFVANETTETAAARRPGQQSPRQEITIREIMPEIKEIPITGSPKREVDSDADGGGGEAPAEAYRPYPPSVLRIGDKLLYLKKDGELVNDKGGASTPATVITIIGAEGLQRGGVDVEETTPEHGHDARSTERDAPDEEVQDDDDLQTVAESTHILSLVRRPTTTSERPDFDGDVGANATDALDVGNWTESLDNTTEMEVATVAAAPSSTAMVHEKEEALESNPEYPPIPDVMTQQVEEVEAPGAQTPADGAKILSEVFELQHAANASASNASDAAAWLKKASAALPDATSTADEESVESTTAAPPTSDRSKETTESLEAAEVGNASVEDVGAELVETLPGYEDVVAAAAPSAEITTTTDDDVELIDAEPATNATRAHDVAKRASNEDDAIFAELEREIGLESGAVRDDQPPELAEAEARRIFAELADEAVSGTTPPPVDLQGATPRTRQQHQQAAALARVGDALAKLRLRDVAAGDANVLGILRDFFAAQYRAHN